MQSSATRYRTEDLLVNLPLGAITIQGVTRGLFYLALP
jgi:hypothetical protein